MLMAKVLKPQLDENLLKICVYEAEWKCRQLLKNAAILQLRGHKTEINDKNWFHFPGNMKLYTQ